MIRKVFRDIKVRMCKMSRSYKKYAVTSCTTSASEKNDKRIAHRVFRKRAKRALKNNKLSLLPFRMRDVSNIWCFAKDGKVTWEYLSSHSFFRRIVTDEQLQDIIKKARSINTKCYTILSVKFRQIFQLISAKVISKMLPNLSVLLRL